MENYPLDSVKDSVKIAENTNQFKCALSFCTYFSHHSNHIDLRGAILAENADSNMFSLDAISPIKHRLNKTICIPKMRKRCGKPLSDAHGFCKHREVHVHVYIEEMQIAKQ